MDVIWMLVIGLVVGIIAKLFMPGRGRGGIIATIFLGIAGSVLAGFVGRGFGWYQGPDEGAGIVASIIGAMFLVFLYRIFAGRLRRA